jgi:hypothetical protein
MRPETLLLRQVNPSFIQNGRVTSQVFRPTPKDLEMLSVDNGDRITSEASFVRFTSTPNCRSHGVMAVSVNECSDCSLQIIEDGDPYPEHCSIDFRGVGKSQTEKYAKTLRSCAEMRGWLFVGVQSSEG